MKYQNLHHHTTVSDGTLSYQESLEICRDNRIGVLAFTDHDSLPSKGAIRKLRRLNTEVNWICGIEITSWLPKELNESPCGLFHIIGLFVNPFDKKLLSFCKKMQAARKKRIAKMIQNLNKLGFILTFGDCLKESRGELINRLHLAKSLEKSNHNQKIISRFKAQIKEQALKDPEISLKYRQTTSGGIRDDLFTLFPGL
ncbi:PHP domain-containing protein [Patescibacteria group bacterium]